MVFGQSIGGDDYRIVLITYLGQDIVFPLLKEHRRWIALLFIKCIMYRRLSRFIVRWQWAIFESFRDKEPAASIGLHDKWMTAGDCVHST